MSTPTRLPRYYQPGLLVKVREAFRYGGGLGQWSWLIHRLTGLGILFFLIIHVLDTFLVVVAPEWYDHTVAVYGGIWFDGKYYAILRWAFRLGELGLIASVVFHAVNGLGVILYDFWHKGALHRKGILRGVQIAFWLIMIPTTLYVLYPLTQPPKHMEDIQTDIRPTVSAPADAPAGAAPGVLSVTRAPRSALLTFGMMGVAATWMLVVSFVPPAGTRVRPASGYELRAWYLMRISGLLLVLLACGHLFIMHIVNNVETINYAFVASRWDAPGLLGPLWRMWDFSLIALSLLHGFNGLRQISHEYITRPGRRVLTSTIIWTVTLALIGIGSYAIFQFKGDNAYIRAYMAKHPQKNRPPSDVSGPSPTDAPRKSDNPLPAPARGIGSKES